MNLKKPLCCFIYNYHAAALGADVGTVIRLMTTSIGFDL